MLLLKGNIYLLPLSESNLYHVSKIISGVNDESIWLHIKYIKIIINWIPFGYHNHKVWEKKEIGPQKENFDIQNYLPEFKKKDKYPTDLLFEVYISFLYDLLNLIKFSKLIFYFNLENFENSEQVVTIWVKT